MKALFLEGFWALLAVLRPVAEFFMCVLFYLVRLKSLT